jgi:hypothetical protein
MTSRRGVEWNPVLQIFATADFRQLDKEVIKRDFAMLLDVYTGAAAVLTKPEVTEIWIGTPWHRSTIKGARVHDLRSWLLIYRLQSTFSGFCLNSCCEGA